MVKFFKKYFICDKNIFDKEADITESTLLINAEFKSQAKFLGIIPFRWVPFFKELLPVNSPVLVKLYFENLNDKEIPEIKKPKMDIYYPHALNVDQKPSRGWHLKRLPRLEKKGDFVYSETTRLFLPEMPGTHLLLIGHKESPYQFADYHGISDRKIKLIAGAWYATFHVLTTAEFYLYIVASLTLLSSIVILGFTIYKPIYEYLIKTFVTS